MAQVNNLIVTGEAAVATDLTVAGKITEQGTPLNEKYLSREEAETTYITATYNSTSKTLTFSIP